MWHFSVWRKIENILNIGYKALCLRVHGSFTLLVYESVWYISVFWRDLYKNVSIRPVPKKCLVKVGLFKKDIFTFSWKQSSQHQEALSLSLGCKDSAAHVFLIWNQIERRSKYISEDCLLKLPLHMRHFCLRPLSTSVHLILFSYSPWQRKKMTACCFYNKGFNHPHITHQDGKGKCFRVEKKRKIGGQ